MDLSKNLRHTELFQSVQGGLDSFKVYVEEVEEVLRGCCEKMDLIIGHQERLCGEIKEEFEVKMKDFEKMEVQAKALREELEEKNEEVRKGKEEFEKCKQGIYDLKDFKFEKKLEEYKIAKKELEMLKATYCLFMNISRIKWDSEVGYSGKILKYGRLVSFNLDNSDPKPERLNTIWNLICN